MGGEALAKECNFDGLMTVLATLNGAAIQRLKRTWKSVSKKTKKALSALNARMDMSLNFRAYRTELLKAVRAGHGVVPYFGVILSDLVMVEEGNPRDAPDAPPGVYNYTRLRLIGKVLARVHSYLAVQSKYAIVKSNAILTFILNLEETKLDDNALYEMSMKVEFDAGTSRMRRRSSDEI